MFVPIFSLVTLLFAVTWGDITTTTKLVFIVLFALSFLLLLIPDWEFLFIVVHGVLIAVMGVSAFGWEWLSQWR